MIDGKTKVIGVLGCPIAHTRSPQMHNFSLERKSLNIVYLPFLVEPKALPAAIEGIRALQFLGANVTLPHKEAAAKLVDELSPAARLIGAINTIVNRQGKLFGTTTDPDGILLSLKRSGVVFRHRPITLLGTGGAARTALFAFLMRGCRNLAVAGRHPEKAAAWVSRARRHFGLRIPVYTLQEPAFGERVKETGLLVNCTSVGLAPRTRGIPLNPALLRKGMVVFDMVYNPPQTRLISEAERRGLKTVGGLSMLAYQGAAAFRLWTGKSPTFQDFYNRAKAA